MLRPCLAICILALSGCPSPTIPPTDAGGGDGGDGQAPRIPWLAAGAPSIVDTCPAGWREETTASGVTTCAPFAASGAGTCGVGEAHLPGSDGCAPVGTPCPTGEWSEELPSDRPIVYVRAGATGGDGSMARPWGSPRDFAFGSLSSGTVVALAAGRHEAEINLTGGVSLWGACARRTELSSASPSETAGVVSILGADSEIRGLSVGPSPRPGIWAVGDGVAAHISGIDIHEVELVAIVAAGDTRLTVEQLVVRDVASRASDRAQGRALSAQAGAAIELHGASIERARDVGAYAGDDGTRLLLEDVAIRETAEREWDRRFGGAISVQGGADAVLRRVLLEDNHDVAMFAEGEGSSAELEDVVIDNTMARVSDGDFGRGVAIQRGATAQIRRSRVSESRDLGIFVGAASLVLEDVLVTDTLGDEGDGSGGRGLTLQESAPAELRRVVFERNREVAVHVTDPGSAVTMEDLVIRDTESRLSDGFHGRGLALQLGASATVARALIEHSRDSGVYTGGEGAVATLTDLVVRDVRTPGCAAARCVDASAGLLGAHGGVLSAERFVVSRSAVCGLFVVAGGGIDLLHGEVRESAIGACLQSTGYDLGRLTDDVAYRDNGANLESTDLPVPEPIDPITP